MGNHARCIERFRIVLSMLKVSVPTTQLVIARSYLQGSRGRGKERGNGRIVVTKLVENTTGCMWETQKLVKLPPFFKDYSDIDITASGRVAVTSQEDAAVWVGHMNMTTFEIEGEGTTLHFPRSVDGCQPIYCNIEGVHFLDEYAAFFFLFHAIYQRVYCSCVDPNDDWKCVLLSLSWCAACGS